MEIDRCDPAMRKELEKGKVLKAMMQTGLELARQPRQEERLEVNPWLLTLLDKWGRERGLTLTNACNLAFLDFLKRHSLFTSDIADIFGIDEAELAAMWDLDEE